MATLAVKPDNSNITCADGITIPRIYSGVANDMRFITRREITEGVGVAVVDLPFSLIADTLVLPYTIVTQSRYGNLCDGESSKNPG